MRVINKLQGIKDAREQAKHKTLVRTEKCKNEMNIQTNKKMTRLLITSALSSGEWNEADLTRFTSIVEAKVLERGGCFFLDVFFQDRYLDMKETLQDDTGVECFVNHFHIEDDMHSPPPKNKKTADYWQYGLRLVFVLVEKLIVFTPNSAFKIILSANKGTCAVRFHKVRQGEAWIDSDLENYEEEAVMVVEI